MPYYDRIDVSEGIDISITSASKECDIFIFWYFLNKGFKFQIHVFKKYHDLLMMSMNLSNIAILKIKSADYLCIITGISYKIISEATELLQNIALTGNSGKLSKFIKNKYREQFLKQ